MNASEFLKQNTATSFLRGEKQPHEYVPSTGEKVAHFLTGHFPYEFDKPEVEMVDGKLVINEPSDTAVGFLNQPALALAAGGVAGVKTAGKVASKALTAVGETLGWATGGASDIPKIATQGAKGLVKAVEAKPMAELRATREASGNVFATVPIKAETGAPVIESLASTAPKTAKNFLKEDDVITKDIAKEADLQRVEAVAKPSEAGSTVEQKISETTGTKRSIVDVERESRGMDEIGTSGLTRSERDARYEGVVKKVDSGEIDTRKLTQEITDNPYRAVSVEDDFAIKYGRAKLNNESESVLKQVEEAQKAGDTVTEKKLLEQWEINQRDLDLNDQAAAVTSKFWHELGVAKQQEIAKDFSLAEIVRQGKIANGGKLTPEIQAKYASFAKRIDEAEKQIKAYEAKIATMQSEKAIGRIKKDINFEYRKIRRTETKVELSAELDLLVKEFNLSIGGLNANPFTNIEAAAILGKIAKNRVKAGYNTFEGLVDEVYNLVKASGMTRREVQDAISGYGVTKQLSKEEINVQLRELKRQMRLASALEDAQKGLTPLRSGLLRDAKTAKVKTMEKAVRDEMKKHKINPEKVKTQEQLWQTAQKTLEKRLNNQIEALNKQLITGEKPVKNTNKVPMTGEAWKLKNTRDFLKEQVDLIQGKAIRNMSPEQRINIAVRNTQKSISEYTRRINEGELIARKKTTSSVTSPELEKLKKDREFLKGILSEMQKAARPKKDPQEIARKAFITRTQNRISELEGKLKTGDFSPKTRSELVMDNEMTDLKFKKDAVVKEYQTAKAKDTFKRMKTLEKSKYYTMEVLNTMRAVKTSMDLSAVLRQGAFIALGHPIRGVRAMPAMMKALRSEKGQFAIEQEIMKRANYSLYERSGLYLSEHGQKLVNMEEAYMSHWADKIPGVAASGRAYTTYLNRLRADSFDAMLRDLPQVAGKASPEEMKAIANYINIATGRGNLGMKENSLVALNTAFFAPRYVLSRFQLVLGRPMSGGTWATKKMIAKEYARFFSGLAVIYATANAAGAETNFDPGSSDFGKIRIGRTVIDPMGGLSQTTVFLYRTLSGNRTTQNGREEEMDARTYGMNMLRFVRSKLSPSIGTAWTAKTGENVVGEKVEPIGDVEDFMTGTSIPSNLVMPLAISDIYDTMREQGIPAGTGLALLSILGMGLQTY
ncbi:MAG: hypothetical protein LLG05_12605 [Porphyromonadaceae bacterium]|nr:hypothetical protein [Porphyromonadaceae bacterium]